MPGKGEGRVEYSQSRGVGTLRLSRPQARNSITRSMLLRLREEVERVRRDATVRVLVVGTGEGGSAGADIRQLLTLDSEGAREFSRLGQELLRSLEELPLPVLAAVEGLALGGALELALACDLIVASREAAFALPEVRLGIMPGLGGTVRLARRVGSGRARELLFTGRTVGAEEAHAMGLADVLLPSSGYAGELDALAHGLATRSSLSLALIKSTVLRGMECSLEGGLALEREAFALCFAGEDAREGIDAFLHKREPVFGPRRVEE